MRRLFKRRWRPFFDRKANAWRYVKPRKPPLSLRFRRSLARLRALPSRIHTDGEAWKVFEEWYYEADRREAFGGDVRSVTAENYIVREMYAAMLEEANRRARALERIDQLAAEVGGDPFGRGRHYRWQRALDQIRYETIGLLPR